MDIDQQIIHLLGSKVTHLYEEAKQQLILKESYLHQEEETVCIDNMTTFISFLEASLQKPFDRLSVLQAFVKDDDDILLTSIMNPLRWLKPEAHTQINDLFAQAAKLLIGMEVCGYQEGIHFLQEENND